MATLRGKRALILVGTALVGLCAFGAYRGVDATHMVLTGKALGNDAMFRYPLWGIAHFAAAVLFVVAVPFQFWPGFRARHRTLHRWSGRALVLAGFVMAGSGLSLVYHMPDRPLGEKVFMTLVFGVFLVFLVNAFQAARARDFVRHRQWMVRAVAGALGAMTQRLLFPFFLATGIHSTADFWDKFLAAAWLSLLVNLAIAEWWIRRSSAAPSRETAGGVPLPRPAHAAS